MKCSTDFFCQLTIMTLPLLISAQCCYFAHRTCQLVIRCCFYQLCRRSAVLRHFAPFAHLSAKNHILFGNTLQILHISVHYLIILFRKNAAISICFIILPCRKYHGTIPVDILRQTSDSEILRCNCCNPSVFILCIRHVPQQLRYPGTNIISV